MCLRRQHIRSALGLRMVTVGLMKPSLSQLPETVTAPNAVYHCHGYLTVAPPRFQVLSDSNWPPRLSRAGRRHREVAAIDRHLDGVAVLITRFSGRAP